MDSELAELKSKVDNLLVEIRALVDRQAEDWELWFPADTKRETYLQAELRKLHYFIEGNEDG